MNDIDKLRYETYVDLKRNLDEFGKVCLVRPTGFGKTGILTKLLREYKNVLFFYPTEVVKDTVYRFNGGTDIPNTRFITYMGLLNLTNEDIKSFGNVDLIICDECHKLGAVKTYQAMIKLIKVFPAALLVGSTATPYRMDLIDVVEDFFDNHVVFEYTLHNAFKDGVLKKPYYCFCSYGVEDIECVEKETRLEIDKLDVEQDKANVLLRSRLIEISNLQRMDRIIRETCDNYCADISYLKFIVFFSDFSHMKAKGSDVESWFSKAFPDYSVNILRVSSETIEYSNNVFKLSSLTRRNKCIDLVFCVDMLNMGYHVESLTGIVMYRGTESGIIFSQQLGRVLSSGSYNAGIVFDVVDNIHREAIYSVLGKKSKKTRQLKMKLQKLIEKRDSGVELSEKELSDLKELTGKFNNRSKWWLSCNDLQPEDLISTGHEATYRELIAKTVAEPISMRCRQAWKRWIERGGSVSPFTRKHILEQNAPDAIPLSPFCELKNVSVEAVLREMGL